MKHLKRFNESRIDLKLEAFNIKLVIDILEDEHKFKFKTINDDIYHQFWIYTYFYRSIGLKLKRERLLNSLWSSEKNFVVISLLDMDIENKSEIYKRSQFGREDGIYIQLSDREVEDVTDDVNIAIEILKDFIELE
jgi:hypothetical protein